MDDKKKGIKFYRNGNYGEALKCFYGVLREDMASNTDTCKEIYLHIAECYLAIWRDNPQLSCKKVLLHLQRAAYEGNIEAYVYLADMYNPFTDYYVDEEYKSAKRAVRYYRKAVVMGKKCLSRDTLIRCFSSLTNMYDMDASSRNADYRVIKGKYVPADYFDLVELVSDENISLADIDTGEITDMSFLFMQMENYEKFFDLCSIKRFFYVDLDFSNTGIPRKDYSGIEQWDVSNVTDMRYMFCGANQFDQPIGKWDVSNVINMNSMFAMASQFNQPIDDWNVSNVTNMSKMFEDAAQFNQSIGRWDVSNVTDMSSMFCNASNFNQPIGDWDVFNVTDMSSMFAMASQFDQSIGNWNVYNVTNMSSMFCGASNFNQPIGDWDVSNVTDMSSMFLSALSFNQPIGGWEVFNVTDMSNMFQYALNFNQPIDGWDISSVINMNGMFDYTNYVNPFLDSSDGNDEFEESEYTDIETDEPEDEEISLDDSLQELNDLIGLDSVKADLTETINLVRVNQIRVARGMPELKTNMHMVFTGNPGTGKTTVARIVAKIYKALGVVSRGHIVETDRAGLVAGYVGQTAIKTTEVVEEAIGGVLFIDEAYSLVVKDSPTDFGKEAIDTLVKCIEDNRDNLIVIVAGYTKEMQEFIEANSGLQSRFNKYIEFQDYTPDELMKIFVLQCSKHSFTLTPEARNKAFAYFTEHAGDVKFGNARGVRNYYENAVTNQASRIITIKKLSDKDIGTLLPEDLDF